VVDFTAGGLLMTGADRREATACNLRNRSFLKEIGFRLGKLRYRIEVRVSMGEFKDVWTERVPVLTPYRANADRKIITVGE